VHPDTGRFAPLAVQPSGIILTDAAFSRAHVPLGAALDVPGLDRAGRRPAVAASTDGGRSWRTTTLPGGDAAKSANYADAGFIWPGVAGGADGTAYADVPRESGDLVYRTTDGGRTWQKTERKGNGLPRLGPAHIAVPVARRHQLAADRRAVTDEFAVAGRSEPV
jgi:hypothetical protein